MYRKTVIRDLIQDLTDADLVLEEFGFELDAYAMDQTLSELCDDHDVNIHDVIDELEQLDEADDDEDDDEDDDDLAAGHSSIDEDWDDDDDDEDDEDDDDEDLDADDPPSWSPASGNSRTQR